MPWNPQSLPRPAFWMPLATCHTTPPCNLSVSIYLVLSGACDVKRVAKHALSRTDPVTQSLQIDTIFPGGVTIWRTFVGDSALLGRNQLAYETRRRATLDSNGNVRLQNTPALRMECFPGQGSTPIMSHSFWSLS